LTKTFAQNHNLSLFMHGSTAECNLSQEKRNYHETTHDGAIGIKEITCDRAIDMKRWFVGHHFFKQAKNRVSD